MYKNRIYRSRTYNNDLYAFEIKFFESNLMIYAKKDLSELAYKELKSIHSQVSDYCQSNAEFEKSLVPTKIATNAPEIIKTMHKASKVCGVGPMATVAGAIAEALGMKLLKYSAEVIIENGGDIFIKICKSRKIGIFAGIGNVYNNLVLRINPQQTPCGICTSSGRFGHSFSKGKTCATIITAKSCAIADGYATGFGNMVNDCYDIDKALKSARKKRYIKGIVIITPSNMGAYGDLVFDILDK